MGVGVSHTRATANLAQGGRHTHRLAVPAARWHREASSGEKFEGIKSLPTFRIIRFVKCVSATRCVAAPVRPNTRETRMTVTLDYGRIALIADAKRTLDTRQQRKKPESRPPRAARGLKIALLAAVAARVPRGACSNDASRTSCTRPPRLPRRRRTHQEPRQRPPPLEHHGHR